MLIYIALNIFTYSSKYIKSKSTWRLPVDKLSVTINCLSLRLKILIKIEMSLNVTDVNEISKWSSPRILQYFPKVSQYLYKCNICTKDYKTPNGGAQNLRSHLIIEGKKG